MNIMRRILELNINITGLSIVERILTGHNQSDFTGILTGKSMVTSTKKRAIGRVFYRIAEILTFE